MITDDTSIWIIVPDPTQAPFVTEGTRVFMESDKNSGDVYIPCFLSLDAAKRHLRDRLADDDYFGIIGLSIGILKKKYLSKTAAGYRLIGDDIE